MSSITYPQASPKASPPPNKIQNMQYNAEGELLGYNGIATAKYTYSTRGELEQGNVFANGLEFPATITSKWDPLMGAPTKMGSSAWSYDAAGRMTQEKIPANEGFQGTVTLNRTYDAENRLATTSSGNALSNLSLTDGAATSGPLDNDETWAPIGSPQSIRGDTPAYPTGKTETLHWGAGGLLYTTENAKSGAIDDLKLGGLGDVMPLDTSYNGVTLYDQGPEGMGGCYNVKGATNYTNVAPFNYTVVNPYFGVQVAEPVSPCQANGTSSTMPANLLTFGSYGSWANYLPAGHGGVLGMPRSDGFATGTDIIQGVRAYDPNSGTWTTPDGFGGYAGDPMSQKSYAWNNNNPLSFEDPTGYCGQTVQVLDANGNVIAQSIDVSDCEWDNFNFPITPMQTPYPMPGPGCIQGTNCGYRPLPITTFKLPRAKPLSAPKNPCQHSTPSDEGSTGMLTFGIGTAWTYFLQVTKAAAPVAAGSSTALGGLLTLAMIPSC